MSASRRQLVILLLFLPGACRPKGQAQAERPLKARCTALFQEALDAGARGNMALALPRIADGRGDYYVRFRPDVIVRSDGDSARNTALDLQRLAAVQSVADDIIYAELTTQEDKAVLRYGDGEDEVEHATVHAIEVTIPGFVDEEYQAILFLEAPSGLYWVPFGW